jgi:DedD protein
MPAPLSDDDHKRRARRRLIGAVALTILAVILLPLVLEDEPPPTGPLNVLMPPLPEKASLAENTVEYAPPSANSTIEPASPEDKTLATPVPQNVQKPVEPTRPTEAKRKEESEKPLATENESGAFVVQVGVFSDKGNVQKIQSRISALGLKSYTEQVGNATRVRLGAFSSHAEADAIAAKLTAAGLPGKVVEK